MSYQQLIKSDVNPNDTTGGSGCLCDPRKQVDCKGPYIIAYGNEMDDPRSPHVVVGASCVEAMHKLLHEGETYSVGERNDFFGAYEPPSPPPQAESPEIDLEVEELPKL